MERVDRRQFIIMRKKYERDDFKYINLSCGLILSYHQDLQVTRNGDFILLGNAFSCKEKEIVLSETSVDEMQYWAGRWILITPDRIYLDSCGHMGLFYHVDEDNVVLSSSLHLLTDNCKTEWVSDYCLKRGEIPLFDFYPIPYTPYKDVMALLPSQCFSLVDKAVLQRSDYNFVRYINIPYDEAKKLFIDGMTKVIESISENFDSVWITTTGGVDSRTVLSLCDYSGVSYKTYTLHRPDTKFWDLKIPQKLARSLKRKHYIFDNTEACNSFSQRAEEQLNHAGGLVTAGTEVLQYVDKIDVPDAEHAVVLWGTTWELMAQYYYPNLGNANSEQDRLKLLKELLGNWFDASNVHRNSLVAWNTNAEMHPVKGMDWRERLYWEQRQAGWLSYSYQTIDLFDSTRIAPVNCQYLLELLLSMTKSSGFSDNEIQEKRIQKEIINTVCPQIAKIKYGEPTSLLYRACRKLKRIMYKH